MGNLFVNFGEAIAMLLFVIGFANLLLRRGLGKGSKVAILLMNCLE